VSGQPTGQAGQTHRSIARRMKNALAPTRGVALNIIGKWFEHLTRVT
jgi:hypothetical protein